ncbi:MAG: hypothetical protein KY476_04395 [Planctomycetes bacterium]|nr:hypothetical protein [Planctomycetota bacterium]
MKRHGFRQHGRRSGITVLVAMLAVMLTTSVGLSLARMALARHRQVRGEQLRLQAEWLAEAALERAAARHAVDENYTGETWDVAWPELRRGRTGRVMIEIDLPADGASERRVRVMAEFPAGVPERARVRKNVMIGAVGGSEP